MKKQAVFGTLITVVFSLSQCGILQRSAQKDDRVKTVATLDTAFVKPQSQHEYPYRPSATMVNDLLHTKLEVSFSWEKQYLFGKAYLTFTPHFYPTDSLVLDAKGFDLHKVALLQGDTGQQPLTYRYDSFKLRINLNKTYTRQDTYRLFIDYTAKPNELPEGNGGLHQRIGNDKGLYFINPLGEDSTKPKQIWTQGETVYSSCWFPTIDVPNEKTTQEIYITVDTPYKTLSNGKFVYSALNEDGTRTDYWKQTKPHAPYLFMMAIGDYAVIEDKWRDMKVNYYVEPEYESAADDIFGHTPEMIEFYSNVLGYDYPWAKYHQVVVRDFVAGAMENTSASIFMERVQVTERELIDQSWDGIIAHELFHHWFGDLVTCESWANLPLNEAFANYGEYLWFEHKYSKDWADYENYKEMQGYLREAQNKQKPLIRYHYKHKEAMFDAHSYNKGGRVLHMLRNYVGDDAFFASLQRYLEENEYQPAEIHDLRLAFEEVTGEDLNWFFNQWFLSPGHPVLTINYDYNDSLNTAKVFIEQSPSADRGPTYKLPMAIDVYTEQGKTRHHVVVDESRDTFSYQMPSPPKLINVDAEKTLLCEKDDNKATAKYLYQYNNAPLYMDRLEAIQHFDKVQASNAKARHALLNAFNDDFWAIQTKAIQNFSLEDEALVEEAKQKLVHLAKNNPNSKIRSQALAKLSNVATREHLDLYIQATKDSSYSVISAALSGLGSIDSTKALEVAPDFESLDNASVMITIMTLYADYGTKAQHYYFKNTFQQAESGFIQYLLINLYQQYLVRLNDLDMISEGVQKIAKASKNSNGWVRSSGVSAMDNIKTHLTNKQKALEKRKKKYQQGSPDYHHAEQKLSQLHDTLTSVKELLEELKT